jgi:hypothetical protein
MKPAPRLRGLQGAVLDAIAPGPPDCPSERWFLDDLQRMATEDLQREQRCYQLRVLLTEPARRDHWPHVWVLDRLHAINLELLRRG